MKIKLKNWGKGTLVLVMLFALVLPSVYGLAVGVSPSKYIIEDALKGEMYQKSMRFSTTSDEDILVNLESLGDYKDWVKFYDVDDLSTEIKQLSILAKGNRYAMVTFSVPDDIPNGEYEIQIAANKVAEDLGEGVETGSAVDLKTFARVKLHVTGNQKLESEVRSITGMDAESGYPFRAKVDIQNTGNVKSNPHIEVEILKDGELVDKVINNDYFIDVGQIEILDVEWDTTGRGVGEFTAKVEVILDGKLIGERVFDFSITQFGSSEVEGSIGRVYNPSDVMLGKVTKLSVDFKNKGKIDFKAKIVGEVLLNGKLEEVIEGEEVLIGPSDRENLVAYFKPLKAGEYNIKRDVVYSGNKLPVEDFTFELDENGMTKIGSSGNSKLPLIIIGAVLLVLVILGVRYL